MGVFGSPLAGATANAFDNAYQGTSGGWSDALVPSHVGGIVGFMSYVAPEPWGDLLFGAAERLADPGGPPRSFVPPNTAISGHDPSPRPDAAARTPWCTGDGSMPEECGTN